MLSFRLDAPRDRPLRLLCLGAHADDIEIGCGGTILRLLREHTGVHVRWVVFSGGGERAAEAKASAARLLDETEQRDLTIHEFRDGFFPSRRAGIKEAFEEMKGWAAPDLIFTHHGGDRHQDHRVVSELTWNTFRDHLVLEYEIPKYDGGLTTPNLYVGLDASIRERKVRHLMDVFGSQRDKRWFAEETFLGLMRLRGVEGAVPEGYAEGFHAPKAVLRLAGT